MDNVNPTEQINQELERAKQARTLGNEGQARVCARRAAGIAARDYFARRGKVIRTPSAYDLLNSLTEDATLSEDLREIAAHLTWRVNEEFKLPPDMDLVAEAKRLCDKLMSD